MAAEADERVRSLVANESRTWAQIGRVVVFGRAYREILRAAETKHAELVVMGTQGRGGVDLALFGSTTQHVVRGAACPVLTVRAQHHMQGRLESLRAAALHDMTNDSLGGLSTIATALLRTIQRLIGCCDKRVDVEVTRIVGLVRGDTNGDGGGRIMILPGRVDHRHK